jgi:hypothetical protein
MASTGFELAVFHEFAAADALKAASEFVTIDQAPAPHPLATSAEEQHIVKTNAKLFFAPSTPDASVDSTLEKLTALGFQVVQRKPITSAGCPMQDRVILRFGDAPAPSPAPAQ